MDPELLKNTVELKVGAWKEGTTLRVQVEITNEEAGHHVPTDHPMRHMLLIVEALDAQGHTLSLLEGPTVPAWGGNYAGQPGKGFAKILEDAETGEAPSIAYWKPLRVQSDTRIPAKATDLSLYRFRIPDQTRDVSVRVRLIFRRTFQVLAQRKGWALEDILMAERQLTLSL